MVDNSFADSIPFGLALPPYSMHSSFHSHVLSRSIGIRRPLSIQLLSPLIPSLSSVPLRALCVKISSLLFAPFVSLVVKSLLSVPYTQPHLPSLSCWPFPMRLLPILTCPRLPRHPNIPKTSPPYIFSCWKVSFPFSPVFSPILLPLSHLVGLKVYFSSLSQPSKPKITTYRTFLESKNKDLQPFPETKNKDLHQFPKTENKYLQFTKPNWSAQIQLFFIHVFAMFYTTFLVFYPCFISFSSSFAILCSTFTKFI